MIAGVCLKDHPVQSHSFERHRSDPAPLSMFDTLLEVALTQKWQGKVNTGEGSEAVKCGKVGSRGEPNASIVRRH